MIVFFSVLLCFVVGFWVLAKREDRRILEYNRESRYTLCMQQKRLAVFWGISVFSLIVLLAIWLFVKRGALSLTLVFSVPLWLIPYVLYKTLWKADVEADYIIVKRPLKKRKPYSFRAIQTVAPEREAWRGLHGYFIYTILVVYVLDENGATKRFHVDELMHGYPLFAAKLQSIGLLDADD